MAGNTEPMTSAGSSIAISAALPSSIDEAGFSALTFLAIAEVTDAGQIGRSYNTVNHAPVGSRGAAKLKGSFDDGGMTLQIAYAPGDLGQAVLEDALDDDDDYAFCLTLQDGSAVYFLATVASAPTAVGGLDAITGFTASLAIQAGTIVRADGADPGPWILAGGVWSDAGSWDDTSTWMDS